MGKERIGILTGGGDCPGLNAVIRGVTKSAINDYNMEVIGFYDGFQGMVEGRFTILHYETVSGILTQGGTILGTSNRGNPFEYPVEENGQIIKKDLSDKCMEIYNDLGLDGLVCVGGDGTMSIIANLAKKGAKIVGVPKTIDRDIVETDTTFGFDSARAIATEGIDRLHTTAQSHHRVIVVEIMGRNAGWLALESGIAGGADIILIPEIPYDINEVIAKAKKRSHFGKRFSIVVVSEGAKPMGGKQSVKKVIKDSPEQIRLGGIGHKIADQIEENARIESRVIILGHLQRGGTPTAYDRVLSTQFAVKAMEMVINDQFDHMVALKGNEMVPVPIEKVMNRQRLVPTDSHLIQTGRSVGTSFGISMG